ncbi:MurR/RpiR family transcriptional regulator [Paenibacillus turpanensis]|uniref:MurR/RpiR family transcriptional regulator n=1 Tax=Paenibacillus turpanensis TaxID=2689078 RepID=UPI001407FA30|nr:MurR/RpiR family transcriptional regulator [Paenibacillus turpanensis]
MAEERKSIESIIDEHFQALSRSMKKAAEYIVRDSAGVAFLPAAQIGELSGVSEASVHRLAAALGFKGFADMQKHIQAGVIENRTVVRLRASTAGRLSETFRPERVMQTDMDNLRRTIELDQGEQLWQSAKLIGEAGRIFTAGWKASGGISSYLAYCLNFMLGCAQMLSMEEMAERAACLGKGDVLIAAGFPRYSAATLKVAEMAQANGANVIVITDHPISPFCRYADVSLFAATSSEGFLDSYTAPFSIANSLVQTVSQIRKERVMQQLEKMEHSLKAFKDLHQSGER